ncbi:MAG: gamma-glutamyl-gamma-aminobutyrate hydrolase family protein [Acholeplasmatales bacterium]|nr:gamma-glutamyl-gamma-aminobutyrate hydrolase family protein [Acholeplasmatales bacterium]
MKKPIIGLMPLWDEKKESLWMLPGYMEGIKNAGGIPIILPFSDNEKDLKELVDTCDGFLFTGGQDVSPEIYNEKTLYDNIVPCKKRDDMELLILDLILKENKPILGICRGIQFINAALGGTLYQDLNNEHKSTVSHIQTPPYDKPIHDVNIIIGTPLFDLIKEVNIKVNSYHHQAVNKLSNKLKPMAISTDGLVEAVYMPNYKFLWAVQWHPEFSYKNDINSKKIFEEFIKCSTR